MANGFEWNAERVEELTKLWATGLSASEIGRKLGITKNAVVGKVRRLDLAMRRQPATPKVDRKVITLDSLKQVDCSNSVYPNSSFFRKKGITRSCCC